MWARRKGVKLFDIPWHFRAISVHDKSWSKKSTTNSQFETSHTFLLITQLTKRNYTSVYFQSSSRLYEKLSISCFCFSDQNNALTATHLTFKFEKNPRACLLSRLPLQCFVPFSVRWKVYGQSATTTNSLHEIYINRSIRYCSKQKADEHVYSSLYSK